MEAGAHGEVDEFVAKYQEAIQMQRDEQASISATYPSHAATLFRSWLLTSGEWTQ
jgi:hypothetical protein